MMLRRTSRDRHAAAEFMHNGAANLSPHWLTKPSAFGIVLLMA